MSESRDIKNSAKSIPVATRSYPDFLGIIHTTRCNLRCFFCKREGFKGEFLDMRKILQLKEPIKQCKTLDITGWGEPFANPRFADIIQYVNSINNHDALFSITTNGSILSSDFAKLLHGRISRFVISLNASNSDEYKKIIRGADFTKVLRRIEIFLKGISIEDRERVILHCVTSTVNVNSMVDFVNLAHSLGIPQANFGHLLCTDQSHVELSLLNIKEHYNEMAVKSFQTGKTHGMRVYARKFFSDTERTHNPALCTYPFNHAFIGITGVLLPCCFIQDFSPPNVWENGFDAAWFSPEMEKLRKKRNLPSCLNCTQYAVFDNPLVHIAASLRSVISMEKFNVKN